MDIIKEAAVIWQHFSDLQAGILKEAVGDGQHIDSCTIPALNKEVKVHKIGGIPKGKIIHNTWTTNLKVHGRKN